MTPTPDHTPQRTSDVDRDAAVRRLQEAFAEGDLAREELDERLHAVLTAATPDELEPVLSSLPGKGTAPASKISTVGGRIRRRGVWRVPRVLTIESAYSKVDLDLSRAIIDYPAVDIELKLRFGRARITLPHDAVVDLDDLRCAWKQPSLRPPRAARTDGPRVRISGTMEFGRLKIRYKKR